MGETMGVGLYVFFPGGGGEVSPLGESLGSESGSEEGSSGEM